MDLFLLSFSHELNHELSHSIEFESKRERMYLLYKIGQSQTIYETGKSQKILNTHVNTVIAKAKKLPFPAMISLLVDIILAINFLSSFIS